MLWPNAGSPGKVAFHARRNSINRPKHYFANIQDNRQTFTQVLAAEEE